MNAGKIEWSTLLGIVGMLAGFISFCINFDRRITTLEVQAIERQSSINSQLGVINSKVDRLFEEKRQ